MPLSAGVMRAALCAAVLAVPFPTPSQATTPDGEAFVAAFGEVCIPERFSYAGTLALAEELGWQPVTSGENQAYDRFIAHADALLAETIEEDPDFVQGSGGAWYTSEIDGRPHLLAISFLLTQYLDTLGCYLYDFDATAPIDPAPVTRLLDHPLAYTSDGSDPDYALDPAILVTSVWGPPPGLARTLDTYLTFIPSDSAVAEQTGFSGLMLKFSTSLPGRGEWEQ